MISRPLFRYTLHAILALTGAASLFWPQRRDFTALALELPIALLWISIALWGIWIFSRRRGFLGDGVPVELTVRLKQEPPPAELMETGMGVLLGALWNGALFTQHARISSWLWIPALVLAAGSLWISHGLLKPILKCRRAGDTLVELNAESVELDGGAKLRVKQLGEGRIDSLSAHLLCEEIASAGQGEQARTERRTVVEQPLLDVSNISVTRAKRAVFDKEIRLPPGAMHSFQSAHNSIEWSVRIVLKAGVLPAELRVFSLPVTVGSAK